MPPSALPADACALESINHLTEKVCQMWGRPELDLFLSRLIMDSRDGKRQGLPLEIATEILFLVQTNKLLRAINMQQQHSNMTLKEAFALIDQGDQKRIEIDVHDQPPVRADSDTRQKPPAQKQRAAAKPEITMAALSKLLFKLVFSKTFMLLVVAAISFKMFWPY